MPTVLTTLDEIAAIEDHGRAVVWLERVAFAFLILMVISAPHSIAATQIAWLTGMAAWIIRLFMKPRVKFRFTALDAALWAFFVWSIVTSLTSYAPDISINKLRGAAVFLIFYFVLYNVRTRRAVHFLGIALIVSCMVNVLWVPVQRLIGRGVEIHGLVPDSPLAKALLWEGDALLEANGKKLTTPEDVVAAIEQSDSTKIKFYRPDFDFVVEVKRADMLEGGDAMSRLGMSSWKKSRNWRSSGFYGHYATYSEVLQLIISLVLGLLVSIIAATFFTQRRKDAKTTGSTAASASPPLPFSLTPLLLFCLVAMSLALLLTVTRASQLAFLISGAVIVAIGLGRKWLLAAVVVGLPLALVGVLFLQQSRQVGFFDTKDESIRWRQTVWREGVDLWTSSPRNFVFGVGMDSIRRHAGEWHLFDDGRLNPGHFHSTPLNLVVERGLPALLLWLMVLGVYLRSLSSGLREVEEWRSRGVEESSTPLLPHSPTPPLLSSPTISRGIILGSLGGAVGFFTSGLVHYNLGDQEVAMMFFLLMGLSIRLVHISEERPEALAPARGYRAAA